MRNVAISAGADGSLFEYVELCLILWKQHVSWFIDSRVRRSAMRHTIWQQHSKNRSQFKSILESNVLTCGTIEGSNLLRMLLCAFFFIFVFLLGSVYDFTSMHIVSMNGHYTFDALKTARRKRKYQTHFTVLKSFRIIVISMKIWCESENEWKECGQSMKMRFIFFISLTKKAKLK